MTGRMTGQEAALTAARAQGCTCNPELHERPGGMHGFPAFDVCHDDWCPLLRSRAEVNGGTTSPQFVMYRPGDGAA